MRVQPELRLLFPRSPAVAQNHILDGPTVEPGPSSPAPGHPARVREESGPSRGSRWRRLSQEFPITSFVVMTFGLTWSIWLVLAFSRLDYNLRVWKYLYVAGLSGPLAASLAITFLLEGKEGTGRLIRKALLWKFSPARYVAALCLAPLLMASATRIAETLFHQHTALPELTFKVAILSFGWMIVRGGPANEELGWRGFLLPRLLLRHNPFLATLILIPIWSLWHWPLWFLRGLPHPFWPFHYFVLILAPTTFLFTWLHLRSKGSVVAAILFHASINTAIQFIPMLPPRHPGLKPFALWIGLTCAAAALVLWVNPVIWFTCPEGSKKSKFEQTGEEEVRAGVKGNVCQV